MANVTMTYGGYNFRPVPLLDMQKDFLRTQDRTAIGSSFKVTLNGQLTPLPSGAGGLVAVDLLQDAMRSGLAQDGQLFLIQCDGTDVLRTYPKVNSISFGKTNNNWVFTSDYTVELEFEDEPVTTSGVGENSTIMPPYINDAKEDWSLEFVDDVSYYDLNTTAGTDRPPFSLKLTHNVSAVGVRHYSSGGLDKDAWKQAKAYVTPRLGYDSTQLSASGTINLNSSLFAPYNHSRNEQIDELGGGYAVSESWLVINTGIGISGRAIEDFNVTVKSSYDNGLTTVSVEGSIQGLETRTYGSVPGDFAVTEGKYTAASGYWASTQARVYPRAALIGGTGISLNVSPLSQSVAHSPGKGTISYNFEYNNRPSNCISGALSEVINIQDTNRTDIFASLFILGRENGPLLQSMNTTTSASRSVSIEVVMAPVTGICPTNGTLAAALLAASPIGQVNVLISGFQQDLTSSYSQVFRSEDSQSWSPKDGRFSKNVTWVYSSC